MSSFLVVQPSWNKGSKINPSPLPRLPPAKPGVRRPGVFQSPFVENVTQASLKPKTFSMEFTECKFTTCICHNYCEQLVWFVFPVSKACYLTCTCFCQFKQITCNLTSSQVAWNRTAHQYKHQWALHLSYVQVATCFHLEFCKGGSHGTFGKKVNTGIFENCTTLCNSSSFECVDIEQAEV